jgi:hypothetical protein
MSDSPVNLSASGPPETVLLPEDPTVVAALATALALELSERRDAVASVVAATPTFLAGWAALGDLGRDDVEAYAYYRVGYHRGLDRMRASGWRGTGYLRAAHEANRGFLDSLQGLARTAAVIGELDEAERCRHFLVQLDPDTYTI